MTIRNIGAHGQQVMQALDAGRRIARTGGVWRGGALTAPESLVADLVRRDLVSDSGEMLVLTAAGRGWCARRARPDLPNRLLAERPLRETEPAAAPRRGPARSVTVNLAESPLGWLMARRLVSRRQFDAGERLRADWETASLGARVTMRWDAAPKSGVARGPGGPPDPTLAQIAAKRRVEAAMAAAGAGLADILWRVVCACEGLANAESALGWPKRAGKLVLVMALDRVADHYDGRQVL